MSFTLRQSDTLTLAPEREDIERLQTAYDQDPDSAERLVLPTLMTLFFWLPSRHDIV